jgi:hypothetical protein
MLLKLGLPMPCILWGEEKWREKGTLKFLGPGENIKYNLGFDILTLSEDIQSTIDEIKSI